MASTAIAELSNYIIDEIPRVIHESLPQVAPFFKDIVSTSVGVSSDTSNIGQLWKVNHLYSAGIAGLIKYADPNGPTTISNTGGIGTQVKLLNFTVDTSNYPTAREAPHAGSLKRTLYLHMTTGNFSVPVTWMQADALSTSQIKQISQDIKAIGDLKAMVEATGFHSIPVTAASGYDVKVLGAITAAAETGTDIVRVTIDEKYGTIHNFRVGMAIDIVAGDRTDGGVLQDGTATDGSDVRNYHTSGAAYYVNVFITNVNYLSRTFDCVGVSQDTGALTVWTDDVSGTCLGSWGLTTNNNEVNKYDYIVYKGCSQNITGRPMPTWGVEDWTKQTGYILGGSSGSEALDVGVYSQFQSLVVAINGPITDDVLNKYVGNYLDSYPGLTVDTIITTNGVTQNYLKQFGLLNNRKFYDSQGKSLNAKGGWSEVAYEFNGRLLRWIVDPMCAAGRLYCMKLQGGNIKRYQPPSISKSGPLSGGAGTDGEVQFLAPLGGHTGVFMLGRTTGGAVMDVLEAPFHQYNMIAPIDPRGIKLYNITEVART